MPEQSNHPTAIYRLLTLKPINLIGLGLLGLLAVGVPLGYGVLLYTQNYAQYGPAVAENRSRFWFLLSTCGLILFIIVSVVALIRSRIFVAVYKDGLNLHLNLFRNQFFRWSELAGVAFAVTQINLLEFELATTYQAVLYPNVGAPIHLPSRLKKLPELISRIKACMYPRIMPALESNLKNNQWVYFGPIQIHQSSIKVKNKSHAWTDIQNINIQFGDFLIKFKDESKIQIPISRIPNLELLLQLVYQISTISATT